MNRLGFVLLFAVVSCSPKEYENCVARFLDKGISAAEAREVCKVWGMSK